MKTFNLKIRPNMKKTIRDLAHEYAQGRFDKSDKDTILITESYLYDQVRLAYSNGMKEAQRWIPVVEQIPPVGEAVLLKDTGAKHTIGMSTGDDWCFISSNMGEISYWRYIDLPNL